MSLTSRSGSLPSARPLSSPRPAPPDCGIPAFEPVRVGGRAGRHRLRRAVRRRRRSMAAALALTAAALAAAVWAGAAPSAGRDDHVGRAGPAAPRALSGERAGPHGRGAASDLVSAPVRIADAGAARLLRPGDRVDVLATGGPPGSRAQGGARVIARSVRVSQVPKPWDGEADAATGDLGALVVLAVPRATAVTLAGAGAASRLAVTLC